MLDCLSTCVIDPACLEDSLVAWVNESSCWAINFDPPLTPGPKYMIAASGPQKVAFKPDQWDPETKTVSRLSNIRHDTWAQSDLPEGGGGQPPDPSCAQVWL